LPSPLASRANCRELIENKWLAVKPPAPRARLARRAQPRRAVRYPKDRLARDKGGRYWRTDSRRAGVPTLSAEDLAKKAKVGVQTAHRAEREDGVPNMLAGNMEATQRTLEKGRVELIANGNSGLLFDKK